MDIQLSIGMPNNPRTWALLNGQVKAEGIDLIPSIVHPSELFWRQLRFADFDVSEMSFSSVIIAISQGDDRWVGLPIFTTRRFFHTGIMVRRDSGIETPADLRGRRVGVPEYQQTAALWNRGILQHEFGVSPTEIEFWMERTPDHSHGGATGFKPPPGVTINQIPPEKSIGSGRKPIWRPMPISNPFFPTRSQKARAILPRPASIRSITAWRSGASWPSGTRGWCSIC